MKMTIYEQALKLIPYQKLALPAGTNILSAGMVPRTGLTLWFAICADKAAEEEKLEKSVEVFVVPSGYSSEAIIGASYVSTVQYPDGAVWHVFVLGAHVRRL